jgi:hypothetical protein
MWIYLAGLIALPVVLYGLHRFCLRLEERGYLYYKYKQPKPGGTPAFLEFQKFIQPNVQEAVEALEHRSEMIGDEGATGDPPHHIVWDPRERGGGAK